MPKTTSIRDNFLKPSKLHQQMDKALVSSSWQLGWNDILIEQYQAHATPSAKELPALSGHWLKLPLGEPSRLTQKRDDHLHRSTVQEGDAILIPAGQPSYWCRSESVHSSLHIYLTLFCHFR